MTRKVVSVRLERTITVIMLNVLRPLFFIALLIAPLSASAEYVTATIPVGENPLGVAVNPATNRTYVTNFDSQNVTVIDGKTNTTVTVAVGASPGPVAVNPVTNKIYVGNRGSASVTVIDGGTNTTSEVAVGSCPMAISANSVTNKIYVANYYSANVTVIDGESNATFTVAVGTSPNAVAVNPVTNKIYVANMDSASVTVIDGATNATETVTAGSGPGNIAVNPVTNKIYVSNYWGNTVTVIDGATNSTSTIVAGMFPAAVAVNPVTNRTYLINSGNNNVAVIDGATDSIITLVNAGSEPQTISLNPVTNRIYVANRGNDVTVIDGATNNTSTISAGSYPVAVASNPVTNKIYVVNNWSKNVSVMDGATNATTTIDAGSYPSSVAVNAVTNKMYVTNYLVDTVTMIDGVTNTTATIATGRYPGNVSVNPLTNKIYVSNYNSNTVTVIDGLTNGTTTVPVGANPSGIRANPVTNKIYVSNNGTNTVTVIDGATNSTSTVVVGLFPTALAVNSVTNKIYVVSHTNNTVTVIDGDTNGIATVSVGSSPCAVAVNQVTNKIYVANYDSGNVTVIDGSTNTTLTVVVGSLPHDVAVNPLTNKIYVTNHGSSSVTVIEGATNSTSAVATGAFPEDVAVNPVTNKIYAVNNGGGSVTVIDGATNTTATVAVGSSPIALAVNPATNKIYVANYMSANVTAISEQQVQPIPLTVAITPLEGNVATVSNPALSFATASAYSPIAPAAQNIYYQVDTWTGDWQRSITVDNGGSFTIPSQIVGFHTVYAFAGDGQEATSTNRASLIGSMTAYTLMTPQTVPGAPTNIIATAGHELATVTFAAPANYGGSAITGYTVISNPSGGQDINVGSSATTHIVTGLNNGTAYTFTVTAANVVGTGLASETSNSVIPWGTPPNPFTFIDQVNVPLSTLVTSNTITLTGITSSVPISIIGGQYERNGNGFWTTATGLLSNNSTVRVRLMSSPTYSTTTNAVLTIGGIADTFSITTAPPAITPDPFIFNDQINVTINTLTTSNSITVTGINMPAPVAISGGAYEINGSGIWSSASGTVVNGNTVRVRQTSSPSYGTKTDTTLTIGGRYDTFSVTTLVPDTFPNPFAFIDQTNVTLSTLVTSNSITVSGINVSTPMTITGGAYEINGNGIWSSASGTVVNGNTVRVRQTSSSNYGTKTDTTLTIGGLFDIFSVTTFVPDTSPNSFAFIDQTNVTLSTLVTSNSITVTGINMPSPVTISGGEYEINGNGIWSSASGTVVNGNTVRVRQTSSSNYGTKTDVTLTIGGVSDTFSVTTFVPDTSPDLFAFADEVNAAVNTLIISNSMLVRGINMPATVTISGGEYEINNSGIWTSASGTVVNGNTIRVRQTSSAKYRTKTDVTLTIGGISGTFSVITLSDIDATLTTNLPSPEPSGTLVMVTSNGIGSSGNYEYKFRLRFSGTWATVQDYSTSNTWTWDTSGYQSGDYVIGVFVRLVGDSSELPLEKTVGYGLYHVGDILTVAGGNGDGAQAVSAGLVNPYGIAQDAFGNMYIADYNGNRIRKIDAATGVISTVAGNGSSGYSGDNGPARSAALNYPSGVTLDRAGNIYIVDTHNRRIRKVDAGTGVITTVAGIGSMDYSGDNGPATSASLDPLGVALDGAGNIYIADNYNSRIRKVTSATGIITTVAGNGSWGYTGDNGPATSAGLNSPSGVALDGLGNMYIADTFNNRVRKVDAITGVITTVAGNGTSGYSGDNGAAVSAALYGPFGISVTNGGTVYIADKNNHRIRKVDAATGVITTIAGSGINGYTGDSGPATSASLASPYGVLVDAAENVLIADTNNGRVRKIDVATGVIATVAGAGGNYAGDGGPAALALLSGPANLAIDAFSNMFIADASNNRIRKVDAITGVITTVAGNGAISYTGETGDNGPATSAYINNPKGMALDMMGNIYIADSGNHRIRKVTALTGVITTVAGNGIGSYSGDNGPATSAMLSYPQGIALDSAGNIYIADEYNGRIRRVDSATGVITTVASSLGFPEGVALDLMGNIYIADTNNSRIRRVDATTGVMTIVAGNGSGGYSGDTGPAVFATLGYPKGVAVDGTGSAIYIADTNNKRIRKVDTATGMISTVAGNGTASYTGDNGPATTAGINSPYGVSLDNTGNVYIADMGNNRIRKVVAYDATPDAFSFTDQTGIAVNTQVISNTITVTGMNSSAAISITGGEYEVNGSGLWTSATGTINNGYSVRVRQTSSSDPSTATTTVLMIGGVSGMFSVTTIAADTTPDAFVFADQTAVPLSTLVTSNAVTITGINSDAPISIIGGVYEINNSGIWTAMAGTVKNGDTIRVRQVSSANYSTTTDTILTVGGVSDTFGVTTVVTLTVTPSAGTNGSISPSNPQVVNYNQTASFTITPNTGYHISLVTGCSGTLNGNTYTTGPITADCTVSTSFAVNAYTVTPSAGTNGSINPSTPQVVNYNQTASFTITPNTGYHISLVTGCSGTLNGNTYTTGPITADCTVTATFTPNTYTMTVTKAGTGTGTVTSSPTGINCGGICTAPFTSSTSVTLRASPGTDSLFVGWSGGVCSGTGTCVTTMNAAKTVTAIFNQYITVTSPSGGESWSRNSTHTIKWNYAGKPGSNVKLELLKAGAVNRTITSSTSLGSNGSGSYSWKIPSNQATGTDYTIRVTSTSNGNYKDTSNADFTIR